MEGAVVDPRVSVVGRRLGSLESIRHVKLRFQLGPKLSSTSGKNVSQGRVLYTGVHVICGSIATPDCIFSRRRRAWSIGVR